MTLNDLANLDVEQRRTADAGAHYEEALKIYRQLVQQNPDVYQPFVAGTLNNLGFLDKSQNRIEESRTHYLEAMTIYQELSKVDPDRYAGDVARVEASLKGLPQAAPSK